VISITTGNYGRVAYRVVCVYSTSIASVSCCPLGYEHPIPDRVYTELNSWNQLFVVVVVVVVVVVDLVLPCRAR